MRESEGLCRGFSLGNCPARETHVFGTGEVRAIRGCESRGETRGASLAEPRSRCGRFRVRAYLLRPERW